MSKSTTVKSLETIIGKLINVSSQIEGNQLQTAIREVSNVRDRVQSGQLPIKKI